MWCGNAGASWDIMHSRGAENNAKSSVMINSEHALHDEIITTKDAGSFQVPAFGCYYPDPTNKVNFNWETIKC